MNIINGISGKTKKLKTRPPAKTSVLTTDRILRADNYLFSMELVNEPGEVIKLKELALAQTVRNAFERALLDKFKDDNQ